jgi:short-subunit dehydrogenase
MRYTGVTALVTGASSGLGAEFAAKLAARGADLVLVARRVEKLETLAEQLETDHGVSVQTVGFDLAEPGAGQRLFDTVQERSIPVSILVNNAGLGSQGVFAESDQARVHDQLAVNVTALTEITRAFVPGLVSRGEGAIVNVASLTAYMPMPGMAVYAACKSFVLNFTEALSYELRNSGVRVMAISPGPTRTEFYAESGADESNTRFETPERVVQTALKALDSSRKPASIVSGRSNRMTSRILGLLPRRATVTLAGRSSG